MHTRLLIAFVVCASSLQAQSVRAPQPDGRRLQLGTDSMEVFLVRGGDRLRTGTIVDRLDTIRVDGEVRFQRVYSRIDSILGNGVDTLIDRFPDLVPRSVASRSDGGGTETLLWREGRLTGSVGQPGQAKRLIDTTVAFSLYSGASFDLIVRASPLADGYSIATSGYSGRKGARRFSARVVGSEKLPNFGDTWRVDADYGGLPVTFWIAKSSRRLVRQLIHVASGTELLFLGARGS
jgi:hypothetical protein